VKKTDAVKHVRATVLARSPYKRTDETAYHSQPIVLLDVDTLWESRRDAGPVRSMYIRAGGGTWNSPPVGWLAVTLPEHTGDDIRVAGLLRYAKTLDLDALPDRADMPEGVRFAVVNPAEVRYTWMERQERRERENRARDEGFRRREEEYRRSRATLAHLAEVRRALKIEGIEFDPSTTPGTDENTTSALRILRVLDRLAKAEGVQLPPRPEHLREQ
jgi:hypothetical protein